MNMMAKRKILVPAGNQIRHPALTAVSEQPIVKRSHIFGQ
jgi:hypothetical protein